jgi:hypothetical protein
LFLYKFGLSPVGLWTLESAASYWLPIFITEFFAALVFYAVVFTKVYQGYKIGPIKASNKYEKY